MTVRVFQNSYQNWTLTSCDTTTAKGQLSWLRRKKRIKHTGEASPGTPRSRVLFQELLHRNMPWCRDMSETLNKFREFVHYGTAGPPIWSMVATRLKVQHSMSIFVYCDVLYVTHFWTAERIFLNQAGCCTSFQLRGSPE